jgi:hypothetical protein
MQNSETGAGYNENIKYGGIKFYRSIIHHPVIGFKKPFKKSEAWIWILAEATWQKEGRIKYVDFGGKERKITLERGELAHSIRFMQDAFGWKSKTKISRFIDDLMSEQMLSKKVVQQISVLSVCNYGLYNDWENHKKDSKRTARRQQKDKLNNDIKDNKKTYTHPLQIWVSKNCKNVSKMKEQLSIEECEKLNSEFSRSDIKLILNQMDNWAPLVKKNMSVNKTLRNWLRKKYEN